MNIKESIIALENKTNILIDKDGHRYQRNGDFIMVTFNNKTRIDNTIASSMKEKEFIMKHIDSSLKLDIQWYQKGLIFPIFCKVKKQGWTCHKVVCFNSKQGDWLQTGFAESHIPSYNTEIIPLADDEIEDFKRGYGNANN